MNLLILGNGFDLDHNMPTKYSDFLYFISTCIKQKLSAKIDKEILSTCEDILKTPNDSMKFFVNVDKDINHFFKKVNIEDLLLENIWLHYFLVSYKDLLKKGNTWIDLENEIASVIDQKISSVKSTSIKENRISGKSKWESLKYKVCLNEFILTPTTNQKLFFDWLYDELKKFSNILERYLFIVEAHPLDRDLDFKKALAKTESIDTVLNFNYTNTYNRLYDKTNHIDFINGELNANIILGIQNHSPNKVQNFCDSNIHKFFKYYQRAEIDSFYNYPKNTARNKYLKWISNQYFTYDKRYIHSDDPIGHNSIDAPPQERTNQSLEINTRLKIYIIGHSLDLTDKQILKEVLLSEHTTKVTVFYYNEDDRIDKLTNLLKLLGEERFINCINNNNAKPYIYLKNIDTIKLTSPL